MGLKLETKNTRESDSEVDPANGRSCWLVLRLSLCLSVCLLSVCLLIKRSLDRPAST